jgi:uncharacterized membrane protein YdcZ (DUF606 family)
LDNPFRSPPTADCARACDHFGWFNVPVVAINTSRIIGAVLLLIGAILMRRT